MKITGFICAVIVSGAVLLFAGCASSGNSFFKQSAPTHEMHNTGIDSQVGDYQEIIMLKLYSSPQNVGWMGWFEDENGKAIAFVTLEGVIVKSPI